MDSSDDEDHRPYIDRAALRREQEARLARETPDELHANFTKLVVQGGADDNNQSHLLIHGLDRVLLEEQRRKIALRPEDIIPTEDDQTAIDPDAVAWAKSILSPLTTKIHPHSVNCHSALQRLEEFVSSGGRFRGNPKMFLPGRMTFMFDSSSTLKLNDIPRAVHTPKQDEDVEEHSIHFRRTVWPSEATKAIIRNAFRGVQTVTTGGGISLSALMAATTTTTANTDPHKPTLPNAASAAAVGGVPSAQTSQHDSKPTQPQPQPQPDEPTDDDIFADVGGLDVGAELRKAATSTRRTADPSTHKAAKLYAEKEKLRLEMGLLKLSAAEAERKQAEAAEEAAKEAHKRQLERAPEEALSPEENPFSLQNASLIPLINQRAADHKARIARATTQELQEASERADAEYGITTYDFDEWADENDVLTADDRARYALGKKMAAKYGKSENDPEILRRVEAALKKTKESQHSVDRQLTKITKILEGKRSRTEDGNPLKRARLGGSDKEDL